jgi:NifU-like protein involved in Fe-S cluster formation
MSDLQTKIHEALKDRKNLGEMQDADAVGTAGSADCGDMLRMWLKFREDEKGRKVIDRATFQSFGCETAIAVASVATELLAGRTAQEALDLSGEDLAAPLGALPPMKIHCAQLVEGALRSALGAGGSDGGAVTAENPPPARDAQSPADSPAKTPSVAPANLLESMRQGVASPAGTKLKVVFKNTSPTSEGGSDSASAGA